MLHSDENTTQGREDPWRKQQRKPLVQSYTLISSVDHLEKVYKNELRKLSRPQRDDML